MTTRAEIPAVSFAAPGTSYDQRNEAEFRGAVGRALGRTQPADFRSTSEWVNVKDFKARGDGVTDDTAAVTAALNSLSANQTLIFPPGTYLVTGQPVVPAVTNLRLMGYGAKITLTGASSGAFRLTGTYDGLRVAGFVIVGSAGSTDSQYGIGTDVTPGAFVGGSQVRFEDIRVSGTNRGLYLDLQTAGDWRDVTFSNCRATGIVGTTSGRGYGIAATIYGGAATDCYFDQCQRHSLYLSLCRGVAVKGNTFRRHRDSVATAGQSGALEIARSAFIEALGNTFDTCSDGAVSIEPHESDTAALTRHIVLAGNTFLNSVHQDIYIGGPNAPSTTSELADVWVAGNQFYRTEGATVGVESIRVIHGRRAKIIGNGWTVENAYTVAKDLIYFPASGGETYSYDGVVADNTIRGSTGAGGSICLVDYASAIATGTNEQTVQDNQATIGGTSTFTLVTYGAARTNTAIVVRGNRSNNVAVTDGSGIVGQTWHQQGKIQSQGSIIAKSATYGSADFFEATDGTAKLWLGLDSSAGDAFSRINTAGKSFIWYDSAGAVMAQLKAGGALELKSSLKHADSTLLHTSVALTNGAGAATATLTNAPAATNPTKWIPVDDNGTTRYIPAW